MAQKILIIQTAFIGDALLSIPLLKNLMRFYPDAEVTYLCRAGMGDFLSRLNLVKVVMEVDKSKASSFSSVQRQLKTQKWDWIICPHESLRSQFLCHGLRASRKTSFKNLFNGITFGERIERPMDLPEALRSLSLLQNAQPEIKLWFEKFSKEEDSCSEIEFKITAQMKIEFGLKRDSHKNIIRKFRKIPDSISMEVEHFVQLRSHRKHLKAGSLSEKIRAILRNANEREVFVIAPGSVWETKIWRRDSFRELIERLTKKHFVILIGGSLERTLCSELIDGLENVYNAAGETSLWESAELLACSDQVLTNDSGAMHLASLSSASLVAVFGPTVVEQGYRPWNNQAKTIESSIYCRPCGKHGAKECPLKNHACMKLVMPDQVLHLLGS